jgi:hypothetical protein
MEPYNGTFEMINPFLVVIDHRYQRELRPALVAAIAGDLRWELFGVPVLFKRGDGEGSTYYCADGQQRIEGAKNSVNPPGLIPVVWFPVSQLADEAAVFVQINEYRIALSALQKHKGKLVAEDPATLSIERAVTTAGLSIAGTNKDQEARTVTAVSSLYTIYERLAEEGLLQTLVVCRDAFEDDSGAFSSAIMRGVAQVIEEQDGAYDRQRLTNALHATSVHAILRKSEELRFDMGGSKAMNVRRAIKALARI